MAVTDPRGKRELEEGLLPAVGLCWLGSLSTGADEWHFRRKAIDRSPSAGDGFIETVWGMNSALCLGRTLLATKSRTEDWSLPMALKWGTCHPQLLHARTPFLDACSMLGAACSVLVLSALC